MILIDTRKLQVILPTVDQPIITHTFPIPAEVSMVDITRVEKKKPVNGTCTLDMIQMGNSRASLGRVVPFTLIITLKGEPIDESQYPEGLDFVTNNPLHQYGYTLLWVRPVRHSLYALKDIFQSIFDAKCDDGVIPWNEQTARAMDATLHHPLVGIHVQEYTHNELDTLMKWGLDKGEFVAAETGFYLKNIELLHRNPQNKPGEIHIDNWDDYVKFRLDKFGSTAADVEARFKDWINEEMIWDPIKNSLGPILPHMTPHKKPGGKSPIKGEC